MTNHLPGSGAFGPDAGEFDDDFDYDGDGVDDLKEALGLPDSLPPIRLPSRSELAAQARKAPLCAQLAALADWVGRNGREVGEEGTLSEPAEREAMRALGVESLDDYGFLWEYALAAGWLVFDSGDDRVLPGQAAEDWSSGEDDGTFGAWRATLGAVLSETFDLLGAALIDEEAAGGLDGQAGDGQDGEYGEGAGHGEFGGFDGFGEFDGFDGFGDGEAEFTEQALALAVLLFVARRDGLSRAELAEVLWDDAAAGLTDDEAARMRADWLADHPDPAFVLLDKLTELAAVTADGDVVRLTPPALAALREHLVAAGVDVPLLPPTAAELTGAQLLAMAEGVAEEEFEAEASAWVAARGGDAAARELLAAAADGHPGERLLAVAAVTRIGAGAARAWRDSLEVPELRGYAKVALLGLARAGLADTLSGPGAGGEAAAAAELETLPEDLAWMAIDLLALACDDEFPDPDELAVSFREAVPPGREAALFDAMWRGVHPDAMAVLNHVGNYHPDKRVAKAARAAARKAASRAG
jgi:hypothetical protein